MPAGTRAWACALLQKLFEVMTEGPVYSHATSGAHKNAWNTRTSLTIHVETEAGFSDPADLQDLRYSEAVTVPGRTSSVVFACRQALAVLQLVDTGSYLQLARSSCSC